VALATTKGMDAEGAEGRVAHMMMCGLQPFKEGALTPHRRRTQTVPAWHRDGDRVATKMKH
jgi:hypothetical protein